MYVCMIVVRLIKGSGSLHNEYNISYYVMQCQLLLNWMLLLHGYVYRQITCDTHTHTNTNTHTAACCRGKGYCTAYFVQQTRPGWTQEIRLQYCNYQCTYVSLRQLFP